LTPLHGIELASEGGLIESGGKLYSFDTVSPKTVKPRDEAWDYSRPYRGYRHFDKYEEAQIDALTELIEHLCDRFDIKRQVPHRFCQYYGDRLAQFEGIIGHSMVRDKSDPAPVLPMWNRITKECRVVPRSVQRLPSAWVDQPRQGRQVVQIHCLHPSHLSLEISHDPRREALPLRLSQWVHLTLVMQVWIDYPWEPWRQPEGHLALVQPQPESL